MQHCTKEKEIEGIKKRRKENPGDMNLKLKLPRKFQNKKKTLGHLKLYDGKDLILRLRTIEPPWRNNEQNVSCIPAGKYVAKVHHSPRFGWSLWIQSVPGRSEILVHIGNYVHQLRGCIAPGLYHKDIDNDGIIDVASSGDAMKILEIYLKNTGWVDIEIKNPPPIINWVENNTDIPEFFNGISKEFKRFFPGLPQSG